MVQSVLVLLAAALLVRNADRQRWAIPLALLLAVWAGTTLPDFDMALGLGHRSGLTHSVLPALITAMYRRGRAVAAGLALGLGLHLSADLFPHAMRGFATIKLPPHASLGPDASYMWIAVNGALALAAGAFLTFRVAGPHMATALLAAAALMGAGYLYRTDGGWWALLLFAGLAFVAGRVTRQSASLGPS